jgi:glycerophosphoryl diester phosphodiesterase
MPVHAWVIDDPAEMRTLIHWGVTGLITDRPDLARAVLRAAP